MARLWVNAGGRIVMVSGVAEDAVRTGGGRLANTEEAKRFEAGYEFLEGRRHVKSGLSEVDRLPKDVPVVPPVVLGLPPLAPQRADAGGQGDGETFGNAPPVPPVVVDVAPGAVGENTFVSEDYVKELEAQHEPPGVYEGPGVYQPPPGPGESEPAKDATTPAAAKGWAPRKPR